jgi:hypothetical protein
MYCVSFQFILYGKEFVIGCEISELVKLLSSESDTPLLSKYKFWGIFIVIIDILSCAFFINLTKSVHQVHGMKGKFPFIYP